MTFHTTTIYPQDDIKRQIELERKYALAGRAAFKKDIHKQHQNEVFAYTTLGRQSYAKFIELMHEQFAEHIEEQSKKRRKSTFGKVLKDADHGKLIQITLEVLVNSLSKKSRWII